MKKVVGILGGISPESTMKYYDHIVKTYYQRYHDYYYPHIVIYSLDFQRFTDFENTGNREGYIKEIMIGITALQNADAEFIIMAANSPHAVFDEIRKLASVPLLSIVEVTADYAKAQGMKTLLLAGIKFTMQSPFYPDICQKRGIKVLLPTLEEQDEIDRIIFEELTIGIFKHESKAKLLDIIGKYKVDGVILGCTELPLILKQDDAVVPLLSTLELHAEVALDYALES